GAQRVAEGYSPADGQKLIEAANQAFTDGKTAAIMLALISSVLGALVVVFFYPSRKREADIFAKAQSTQPPGG
ncbi:MAG: hypothetical protein WCK40_05385, partial [Thermoleophilia bacterium]